jgi:cytochrome c oxidase subunit 2
MIVFVIRYRRSKHPEPEDIRGNWKLEVLWTVVPSIIALSMFYFGWTSYTGLRDVPEGALEIEVTGQMYSWLFLYPNEKETENELVVPLGKPVKLIVTSSDVLHSLYIPAYRIKVDAVPGMSTYSWFLPDKLGSYFLQCAEFCGVGHADMTATLRIVPEMEYRDWLDTDEEE